MTQTLTLQDNRWLQNNKLSYPCVLALWHRLWHFKKTDKVIPVSALWHRLWHFKKTDKVITVCQHYDTYIDTARKQMKLSLCVSIDTDFDTSRQQIKLSLCVSIDTDFDTSRQQIKLSLCVSIVTQTMTLQENRSYPCVSALWHRYWHFKTTDKVIPVYQHYDTDIDTSRQQKKLPRCVSIMTDIHTSRQQKKLPVCQHYDIDIDTSRQQMKLSLCVSIMTDIHTSRQQKKLPLCVSIKTRTLTLQDNKWSYTCVSVLWHKHWHFKTTYEVILVYQHWHFKKRDEVIPVCQHYDTDIDTSRQQMKLSLCVSIMTQTLTLQDNKWSHSCMSALWHRLWHFKTTNEVIPVCQHYDTDFDTSRQQMKSFLYVSIMTQTLTLQDKRWSYSCVSALWHRHWYFKTTNEVFPVCQHYDTDIDTSRQHMKLSLCQHYNTDIDTSRQEMKLSLCVSIMTQTLTLQDKRWSYSCVSALWHRHWYFKTTNEVIPVCQHYDTYIDTSKQ